MARKYTKKIFSLLNSEIIIGLSYQTKDREHWRDLAFFIQQKLSALIALLFLVGLMGLIQDFTNINFAYFTNATPLLESISPQLANVPKELPQVSFETKKQIIFQGPTTHKKIALTFDADMTPEMKIDLETNNVKSYYDHNLVNILKETDTKATLFLSGMWIESYPEVAKELSSSSLFELANHTYSHPAFDGACYGLTQAHNSHKMEELQKTQKLLKEITGFDNKLFRFPGGCYSEEDLDTVSKTGQTAIQWDVAGQDGFNGDTEAIVSNVVDNVKNGSIIVLHMNGYPNEPATAIALPTIISSLRQKGYEFVTVSELLGMVQFESKKIKEYISLNYIPD